MVVLGKEFYERTGQLVCKDTSRVYNNLPSFPVFEQLLKNNNVDKYKYYLDVGYPLEMIPGKNLTNEKKMEKYFPLTLSDGRVLNIDFCDLDEIVDRLPVAHCYDQYGYKYIATRCMIRNAIGKDINFHRFRYDKPVYLKYNVDNFLKINHCPYRVNNIPEGCNSNDNIELISIYGEIRYTCIRYLIKYVNSFTEDGRIRHLMVERTKSITKEEASECLINKCKELGRPLTMRDILEWNDINRVSMRVIINYWKSFTKMNNDLGLYFIDCNNIILDYAQCLECIEIVCDFVKSNNRQDVTLNDFDDSLIEYKYYDLAKCLKVNNTDMYNAVKLFGCTFAFRGFGHQYVFEDGEITVSTYEYDFSILLKKYGFIYEESYFRDVSYTMIDDKYNGKMNCDYQIFCGNQIIYVELCGILNNANFANCYYTNKSIEHDSAEIYRQKLNYKKELLERNNAKYYFIIGNDLNNNYFENLIITIKTMEVIDDVE